MDDKVKVHAVYWVDWLMPTEKTLLSLIFKAGAKDIITDKYNLKLVSIKKNFLKFVELKE